MADEYKPQQGDEAELFELYNDQLMRRVSAVSGPRPTSLRTPAQSPGRNSCDTSPTATANGAHGCSKPLDVRPGSWTRSVAISGRSRMSRATRRGYPSRSTNVTRTPSETNSRRQSTCSRNSRHGCAGSPSCGRPDHRYSEIQEITGDSQSRVSALVRRANDRIHEALQELAEELPTPPRAERLRELESSPPRWLTREIGRPPRGRGGREGYATRLLDLAPRGRSRLTTIES